MFSNDPGVNVIKLNDGIFYETWTDYLNSLLLHNYFFPDTAYSFIGFTKRNDKIYAVVKQPFIKETEPTDLNKVREFMNDNGFINKKNNDYYNQELGPILEDLHEGNVLTKDGILYFIDTVFFLDKKMGSGGEIEKESTEHAGTFEKIKKGEIKTAQQLGESIAKERKKAHMKHI